MSENKKVDELHGCIVCAKIFNVLAVYAPDGKLVDFAVTSPGGHRVAGERQPLVACDSHTGEEIETAHQKWLSSKNKGSDNEEDEQ